ncbi:hypothetical protein GO003_010800 [Methylicorpusculum oleiharenae]|uniref:hypothetical protein n=1 Tax=Methylicorpusculum oleiharenae TaxID=1338687 RepID=UPI001357291A|nr:hypothetical protein [Methylicorpusculum oleiharenae]MCD2450880.1 hypothetical protein [Methylicorpusculum oleiharenae]
MSSTKSILLEGDRLSSVENGVNSFVLKAVGFNDFAETAARLGVYWLATSEGPPR